MDIEISPLTNEQLQQMQLALKDEDCLIDRSGLPCRYTAERFRAYYPERYEKAVKLLAAGFSEAMVAKYVHADYRVIRQVAIRGIEDVDKARAIVQKQALGLMMALGERTMELIDRAQKPAETMIPMGIAKDIYLQMGGLPTAKIEVDHKIDCGAELAELLRKAEEKVKTAKAHVVEPAQLENGSGETTHDEAA